MKFSSTTLLGFLLLSFISAAQDFEVPANLPATKDEFVKSDSDFINAAKWLESTGKLPLLPAHHPVIDGSF